MNFFKKNSRVIIICVVFVLVVFVVYKGYRWFSFNSTSPEYGDRLNDLNKHKISDNDLDKMEKGLKDTDKVNDVTYNIKGKILNIIITVSEDIDFDKAKEIGEGVVNYFKKDQMSYYDVQVYVKNSNEKKENYPIIGYKQYKNSSFTWTKDR